jgi:5'-methylthioadenosine phosphorylase
MTAMPEARFAREAQMCYALIALASDYDCWKEHDASIDKQALLAEIIGNLTAATTNAIELIEAVLKTDGSLCTDECSCRKSLELAVWTDPKAINPERKKELAPLFD